MRKRSWREWKLAGLVMLGATLAWGGVAVQGTVEGPTGGRIGGAAVLLQRLPSEKAGMVQYRAQADSQGSFLVKDVEAGQYRVCVPDVEGYLDPCVWGGFPIRVQVATDAVSGVRVMAMESSEVKVQLADTATLLSKQESKKAAGEAARVLLQREDGLVVPMRLESKVANGRRYRASIPAKVTLLLRVESEDVEFLDSTADEKTGKAKGQSGVLVKKIHVEKSGAGPEWVIDVKEKTGK